MARHAVSSRATILGHPIHVMLVGLPIGFYTGGVAALIALGATGDPFWRRAAMIVLFAGVVTALVSAVFGTIDLFAGVPQRTPARATGVRHFGANVVSLLLFAGAAFMLLGDRYGHPTLAERAWVPPLALACMGLVLTLIAGGLGWKLVQTHGVGLADHRPE